MEGSEDDAGAATNASRRESAREKDTEQAENVDATANIQQETSEPRSSCQTPGMSEYNFDGDSVSSPSSHDVNTSTEAILDMIDEFVDGPGAPKRVPCAPERGPPDPGVDHTTSEPPAEPSDNLSVPESEPNKEPKPELPEPLPAPPVALPVPPVSLPVLCTKSEILLETNVSKAETQAETASSVDISEASVTPEVEAPHTSSTLPEPQVEVVEATCTSCTVPEPQVEVGPAPHTSCTRPEPQVEAAPVVQEEPQVPCVEAEAPSSCLPPSMASSSITDARDTSESNVQERTVKCVTSSESNDNVTVESAESTSSDNVFSASSTRSPLRRRLVRPARPDTTVSSSTVDVHTNIVLNSEPKPNECVVKDVSSSSDAVVSSIQGQSREETQQASNVSEVSVCKAETSVSTPKKIKLIRNKITAPVSHTIQVTQDAKPQQCQSTSSLPETCSAENSPVSIPEPSSDRSSLEINCISTSEKTAENVNTEVIKESRSNEPTVEKPSIKSENKPIQEETPKEEKAAQSLEAPASTFSSLEVCQDGSFPSETDERRVPPIKLSLSNSSEQANPEPHSNVESVTEQTASPVVTPEGSDTKKQVPKLTIKLGNKPSEEMKAPVPKLTIKPIQAPVEEAKAKSESSEQIPNVTKLNIKPILKPPEKINDIHRKSSSSEISESECSENDETSTSDQASASDQGPAEVVPKVTIKLGKRGTESEGKFYTEKSVPKLTIKGLQNEEHAEDESISKIKLKISQSDERTYEKVPKLTIKPVTKQDSQPLSPKLTIKPIKPPESAGKDASLDHQEVLRIKISQESLSPREAKENSHVPKITIKPVTKQDTDIHSKPMKKTTAKSDDAEHIPVVTKLNIKPIPKPTESSGESSDCVEDKVPVVSKLNIKPIVKPKDNEVDSSIDNLPKVTKLNIKPIKNPEENFSESKDCDEWNTGSDEKSIPVVTKLNIKPIVKPSEEGTLKDSENQSSETGNSSDENTDQIPVVTKLNIKPIVKPNDIDYAHQKANSSNEESIPVVTKLNIKPLIKPDESTSPSSPKKDFTRNSEFKISEVPVVTKINIKPIVKPETMEQKSKEPEESTKNPPLVMKINIKSMTENSAFDGKTDHKLNTTDDHKGSNHVDEIPVVSKINIKPIVRPSDNELLLKELSKPIEKVKQSIEVNFLQSSSSGAEELKHSSLNCEPMNMTRQNCLPDKSNENLTKLLNKPIQSVTTSISKDEVTIASKNYVRSDSSLSEGNISKDSDVSTTHRRELKLNEVPIDSNKKQALEKLAQATLKPQQSCTLLKKLLEDTSKKVNDTNLNSNFIPIQKSDVPFENHTMVNSQNDSVEPKSPITIDSDTPSVDNEVHGSSDERASDDNTHVLRANWSIPSKEKMNELVARPLEINTASDKITSSGQDSPRIILKINKTDHGASSEIITEDVKKPEVGQTSPIPTETKSVVNDTKNIVNSRKKHAPGENATGVMMAKRLRSSKVIQETEKSPLPKRNTGKRAQADLSPEKNKESEMSVLETKRIKLNKLLMSKSLTMTPVAVIEPNVSIEIKHASKTVNNSVLNNENCSKNGNSKLHKILSNLQAKQMQALPRIDVNCTDKNKSLMPERDSTNTSTGSSDVLEVIPIENSHEEMQEMLINESSVSRDFSISIDDDANRDPLEVETSKVATTPVPPEVLLTPQPRKRGRPRKIPLSEGAIPAALPKPALEERPQRSLRLSRDRPVIVPKRRGRGRGRGAKRPSEPVVLIEKEPIVEVANQFFEEGRKAEEDIDPTSSRIKLPRLTEALDKMPSTPLSSRRRSSSGSSAEVKEEPPEVQKEEEVMKSPEFVKSGRGGRGRGGRGRTPGRSPRRGGRGRGGGRGATYMKETMGIYGRVCGPATTTVQLFEEETCMMDDNATPAKPVHLMDEDSQSSVKSSTNESSSKARKSKFSDLFDSKKVWTAADVKEYMWPPVDNLEGERQVMMIQEQVAMFLGVKSFKRRYPELKRRAVIGDERLHLLATGCVPEPLADLGITAVDASEVLDIMLSDFPHKYEEYRAHLRQKQMEEQNAPAAAVDPLADVKEGGVEASQDTSQLDVKIEMKPETSRPEPPKVDPEKLRQEMAAAAMASASEWNARMNAFRRPAAVDLQSMTIHRRRAPLPAPRIHVVPPAGLYPHALLPGQYQHWCRVYTPEELRYFPLNTALAAPPAPPSPAESESESDPDYSSLSSSEQSDHERSSGAKRKRLSKVKRRSNEAPEPVDVETCRTCGMREEANRKYSHERFLACAHCHVKIHPSCLELGPDTIRKCREYAWQCAECKSCCACQQPADDDKMLFCDLCDRGFHIYCVGLNKVPSGRWHCVECAVCKSCGAREPAGLAGPEPGGAAPEWHHQSKRGPGGHKVYSHSLCTPCARKSKTGPRQNANTKATQLEEKSGSADKKAYRIGRYCPLCAKSFIGPKGTMQLVICKLCDRQLHQDCVRQTVSNLNVLDYTCGECRRGGITSRAAAARLAPRTIATLFMAKRRFNKYAHRQYMQSRLPPKPKPSDDDTVEMVVPEQCDDEPEHSEVSDPLDGTPVLEDDTTVEDDEAAAAVKALQMDFGD